MPDYLTRKDNTYYFRQTVPVELRRMLSRSEIKKSLGRDFVSAVRACKRFAVTADNILVEARVKPDSLPSTDSPYSRENIRRTQPVQLTEVTPELETLFGNLVCTSLLETDQGVRIQGMSRQEFEAYGQHIEAALEALRRQLAMGDVAPLISSSQAFLFGRGYVPDFSESYWRRLAYAMTQASLEAYEAMAARQKGAVVKPSEAQILPSQYEVQHAAKALQAASPVVTWQALYDLWAAECERRDNTKAAYLAAMNLFNSFCPKMPQAVVREDVLAYRDFLLQEEELASGTVANKIGFLGTLLNSGRNSSQFVKFLSNNPFENIKIKSSKRGKAGTKRLPFSDAELAVIFSSPVYRNGLRPRGPFSMTEDCPLRDSPKNSCLPGSRPVLSSGHRPESGGNAPVTCRSAANGAQRQKTAYIRKVIIGANPN